MDEKKNSNEIKKRAAFVLLISIAIILFIGWLLNTPAGLFGKTGAIGYAFCHRIVERSFVVDGHQFPLCARCSGMYLGALLALIYQIMIGKKHGGFPPKSILAALLVFLLAFAVDGTNSVLQFVFEDGVLYQTTNATRMITGSGVGLGIGLIIYPLFHQSVWMLYERKPVINNWNKFGILLLMAVILVVSVLFGPDFILYLLAILGALSVFALLVILYTLLYVLLTKQDNKFMNYAQLKLPVLIGFVMALGQVVIFNYLRFFLTGTWSGFPSLP